MEIVFLRYRGLHHNWDMLNEFLFDSKQAINHISMKVGASMWLFCLLEQVNILASMDCSSLLIKVKLRCLEIS